MDALVKDKQSKDAMPYDTVQVENTVKNSITRNVAFNGGTRDSIKTNILN